MSMSWQYAAPVPISSIFPICDCRLPFTQASMSCLERFWQTTEVLKTLTAMATKKELGGGGGLQSSVDGVVWHCWCFRWGVCLLRGRTSLKLQQLGGQVSFWQGEEGAEI